MAMISHTTADLEALADEHDRKKARGFVERAGLVMLGGLPEAEMGLINQAVRLSAAEENVLVNWSTPPSWDPDRPRVRTAGPREVPGQGRRHGRASRYASR